MCNAKKASSIQPQPKRLEIHIFSSKSCTVDSDDEIIELTSPDHGAEVIEIEEAHGKHTSLRPLYDLD